MDVGKLQCDHIHPERYEAKHPDAPELVGSGATPEEACEALAKLAGKPFKAYHRGASVRIGEGSYIDGPVLFEGSGNTPDAAWSACNKAKAAVLKAEADKLTGK